MHLFAFLLRVRFSIKTGNGKTASLALSQGKKNISPSAEQAILWIDIWVYHLTLKTFLIHYIN